MVGGRDWRFKRTPANLSQKLIRSLKVSIEKLFIPYFPLAPKARLETCVFSSTVTRFVKGKITSTFVLEEGCRSQLTSKTPSSLKLWHWSLCTLVFVANRRLRCMPPALISFYCAWQNIGGGWASVSAGSLTATAQLLKGSMRHHHHHHHHTRLSLIQHPNQESRWMSIASRA